MFVVPPPISKLITTEFLFFDTLSAPAPFPAIIDSKSGPAVATTKSPARSLNCSVIRLAFSLRAVSPVIVTAPVLTSDF